MRKTFTILYKEYSKRYNNNPKHNFSHFIKVMSMIEHHRTIIRPMIKWWKNIN